jgi:phenylalanine-4-hydroxylase
LPSICTDVYFDSISRIQFRPDRVPDFKVVNRELAVLTGWQLFVVPGIIDNKPFFELLAQKRFPATTWLRKMSQLKYIEEPDMFHDVFGHAPMLSETFYCDFLEGLSKMACAHIENPEIVEMVTRIYWYTIEFGLIREGGQVKIYGAGLISSPGESKYRVSEEATHVPYDVATILATPYVKEKFQPQYFVIESYRQLFDSLPEVQAAIDACIAQG